MWTWELRCLLQVTSDLRYRNVISGLSGHPAGPNLLWVHDYLVSLSVAIIQQMIHCQGSEIWVLLHKQSQISDGMLGSGGKLGREQPQSIDNVEGWDHILCQAPHTTGDGSKSEIWGWCMPNLRSQNHLSKMSSCFWLQGHMHHWGNFCNYYSLRTEVGDATHAICSLRSEFPACCNVRSQSWGWPKVAILILQSCVFSGIESMQCLWKVRSEIWAALCLRSQSDLIPQSFP